MKEVRELILNLNATQGMTILLSSHLLNEIEQVATRMCILHKGELVVQGAVDELLSKEAVIVRIQAEPKDEAMKLLSSMEWISDLSDKGDHLRCSMAEDALAQTNGQLVNGGCLVSSFSPRRSLEDYFLSITEQSDPQLKNK